MASGLSEARTPEGVTVRHARGCGSRVGAGCSCEPGYQAQVFSAREGRTIRKTFRRLGDARAWRASMRVGLQAGTVGVPSRVLLREAAGEWLGAAEAGVVRTRSGDRYKPSALRSYRNALEIKALPELGHVRLSAVTRPQVQDLVDRLLAEGLAASTVRNAVLPLRAIYRRAMARGDVMQNPTVGLTLPAVRGRRDRVARPAEASALIAALGFPERAIYATALYAGLRRGELQGLRSHDIDLEVGVIRVERGWDSRAGAIEPKSRSGRRRVPIPAPLRTHLIAHRLQQPPTADGPVFQNHAGLVFSSQWVAHRASIAWKHAGLDPIGLHECRHTYAAFMIAAGVNAKALSTYMGHSSITITLDRYGHLMPGAETEAADMLATYLENAKGATVARPFA